MWDHCKVTRVGPEPEPEPAEYTEDGRRILHINPNGDTRPTLHIWTCSNCGKSDEWGDTWSYWGSPECKYCWTAAIDWVACSRTCFDLLSGKKAVVRRKSVVKRRIQLQAELELASQAVARVEQQIKDLE